MPFIAITVDRGRPGMAARVAFRDGRHQVFHLRAAVGDCRHLVLGFCAIHKLLLSRQSGRGWRGGGASLSTNEEEESRLLRLLPEQAQEPLSDRSAGPLRIRGWKGSPFLGASAPPRPPSPPTRRITVLESGEARPRTSCR